MHLEVVCDYTYISLYSGNNNHCWLKVNEINVHFFLGMCGCIKLQYRFGLNDAYHTQIERGLVFYGRYDDIKTFGLHVLADVGE